MRTALRPLPTLRWLHSLAHLALFALAACAASPPHTVPAPPPRPEPAPYAARPQLPPDATPGLRLPDDVQPLRYRMALEVDPAQESYAGRIEITVRLTQARQTVWLHAQRLRIESASAVPARGGEIVPAEFASAGDEGLASLRLPFAFEPGEYTLRLAFRGDFNAGLQGHFRLHSAGQSYAFTKFEPLSARLAFPCFDEPRFKAPVELELIVPEGAVAVGNTRALATEPAGEHRTRVRFAPTEPLPTYLVAWAVGAFDVVETTLPPTAVRDRPLPVRALATRGRGAELGYAIAHVREIVEALEGYFGVAYPFDKLDLIAAPDYPAGAMENAGAIMFREPFLLLRESDAAELQRRAVDAVLTHEIAHQWFGDMVTMADWDDLWLNEGFADWITHRVLRALRPAYQEAQGAVSLTLDAMSADSLASARRVRQPIATIHDVRNAFDAITYTKGAAVLRMFERFVGAEAFQRGVRAYLAAHRFGNASADDLLGALSRAAGRDVAAPFHTFLDQSGAPLLTVHRVCDARGARLEVSQSRYLPAGSHAERERLWQLPVCVRYPDSHGDVHERCELLAERTGTIALPGGACPAWVMPNADGAGYYRFEMPADDRARLMRALPALPPTERLAVADGVRAQFESGALPAAEALASLRVFAADDDRFVASVPMDVLRFARSYLVEPAQRPRVEAFARALYGPRLRALGWEARPGEGGEAALMRRELVSFLTSVGRDPALRREAAERGRRYLGVGGDAQVHADAVSADLVSPVLAVAVQDGDAAVFDAALAHLRTEARAVSRGALVRAVGSATTAAQSHAALELALAADLRGSEVLPLLGEQLRAPETRAAAWQWLREHFDAALARVPAQAQQYAPTVARFFCDEPAAADAEAFLTPRVQTFVGAPRNLAGALEGVRLCAARVDAQRASARAFFAHIRPGTP